MVQTIDVMNTKKNQLSLRTCVGSWLFLFILLLGGAGCGHLGESGLQEKRIRFDDELANRLAGRLNDTFWQWDGPYGETILFQADGTVEHAGWTGRGLVTRWEAIDRRTVLLIIDKGRTQDLYAVLMFDEAVSAFAGYNFHYGTRLEVSRKLDLPVEGRISVDGMDSIPSGSYDHFIGWFALANRDEQNRIVEGTGKLIPFFKINGTYYSVCRGFEIPFKERGDGLEWDLTPSSMEGTRIGFDEGSNTYTMVIDDAQLEHHWQFYNRGEKKPVTKVEPPAGLLDPTTARPRARDDFAGWYQAVWFWPMIFEIRKEGGKFFISQQELGEGEWTLRELTPLADPLGFTGFDKGNEHRFVFHEALKRFELTKTSGSSVIRMPFARIASPQTPEGRTEPPKVAIGIPTWH